MKAKIIINIGKVKEEDSEEVMKVIEVIEKLDYGYELNYYNDDDKEVLA